MRPRWSYDNDADQFAVDDPATGRPLVVIQGSGVDEVDQAVRVAHEAHFAWKARTPRERGKWLWKAAQVVREHADEIAALESSDNGKPVTQARQFDLEGCITVFEMFAGLCEAMAS